MPNLQKSGSCPFLCGLRVVKFWYNSYFIVTLNVINLKNGKGVPKKIQSIIFDTGVKNQKFKVDPIGLKFLGGM